MPNPEPGRVLGRILWDDGIERDLTLDLLPNLEPAYAITIHKAQGSPFRLPSSRSQNLACSTARCSTRTRAQQQVILVGDVVASTAVEAPLHALMRQVALGAMLDEILDGMA